MIVFEDPHHIYDKDEQGQLMENNSKAELDMVEIHQ